MGLAFMLEVFIFSKKLKFSSFFIIRFQNVMNNFHFKSAAFCFVLVASFLSLIFYDLY